MISRTEEEDIRRIVREEIALDELRRLEQAQPEQERTAPRSIPPVPGTLAPIPGTEHFTAGQQVHACSSRWTRHGWKPVEELATVINPCVENDPVYAGDVEIRIEGVLNRIFVDPASLKPITGRAGAA